MIRVLVCEDSLSVSQLLVELINADGTMFVIGVAGNGRECLDLCRRLRPDVIAMDVRMPLLDGLDATRAIMAEQPTPIVLISDGAESNIGLSITALDAGALAVMPKPHGPGHPNFAADCERLRQQLILMSSVKLVRRWQKPTQPARQRPAQAVQASRADSGALHPQVVAIGASTGGPSALMTILSQLPPTFDLPILITQHIIQGFGDGLAQWLGRSTGRHVVTACEGMVIKPNSGLVLLAPDHCHLILTVDHRVRFSTQGPVNSVIPSIDVMFESIAQIMGAKAIGVLLTGMGRDGAQGLKLLHQAGAHTIVQDEATSIVYGMPKEAIALGAATATTPLDKIADRIVQASSPISEAM